MSSLPLIRILQMSSLSTLPDNALEDFPSIRSIPNLLRNYNRIELMTRKNGNHRLNEGRDILTPLASQITDTLRLG